MHGTARKLDFRQTLNPTTFSTIGLAGQDTTLFRGSGLMQSEASFRQLPKLRRESLKFALPENTPGLHDKILHNKIFARVWVAQEPIFV